MLAADHRCTALTRDPGRRPAAPICSAGMAASMAVHRSGQRYQASAADTTMYADTGISFDSSDVRSIVIGLEISEWYAISRLASAFRSVMPVSLHNWLRLRRTERTLASGARRRERDQGVRPSTGAGHPQVDGGGRRRARSHGQ